MTGAGTTAAALTWWMPLQEVRMHASVATSGATVPRSQVAVRGDARETGTCVLVLTDTETGPFAIAAVPMAACR